MRISRVVYALAALAVGAAFVAEGASAQQEPGQWKAVPQLGYTLYDDATPLEEAAQLGLETHFSVSENFAVGATVSLSRPEVNGSYFPLVLFQFAADSTFLFEPGSQATQATYGVIGTLGATVLGKGYLYAQGGVGGYTFWMDPQVLQTVQKFEGNQRFSGFMLPVGAGFSYRVSGQSGFRFEVRDEILFDFDRDRFNPVQERFQNTCATSDFCIPEANGTPPEASDTVHNIRLSLGFEFIPGG